jgi:hypothetical protein
MSLNYEEGKITQLRQKPQLGVLSSYGDDGYIPEMNERVSKLEGQQEGLKQSQLILLGAITMVSAILIALGLWIVSETKDLSKQLDTKTEALSNKVEALPNQISNQLRDLTQTLSSAITASKQQPPQIILMPYDRRGGDFGGAGSSGGMGDPTTPKPSKP